MCCRRALAASSLSHNVVTHVAIVLAEYQILAANSSTSEGAISQYSPPALLRREGFEGANKGGEEAPQMCYILADIKGDYVPLGEHGRTERNFPERAQ